MGNFAEAIQMLNSARQIFLNHHITHQKQGKISRSQDVEINRKNYDNLISLGFQLLLQKQYREAIKMFNQCIDINPQEGIAYLHKGWIYQIQGSELQAGEYFEKAFELNPGLNSKNFLDDMRKDQPNLVNNI